MKYLKTELESIPWIRHGFFTRLGGVGQGIYDSLNCAFSAKDDPETTLANRKRVAEAIGIAPENMMTVTQRHTADVVNVTAPWDKDHQPVADGLVTSVAGFAVGVLTADCAPVLLASKKDKIVGAAHAGWKGAVGGILENTVAEMEKLGAKRQDIVAAIGPCIGPLSYEVGKDFEEPFLAQDKTNARFFRPGKPGHLVFDLPAYVAHRLNLSGITTVYDTAQDTLAGEDKYFSYRRSCLRNEPDYGRQISIIAVK